MRARTLRGRLREGRRDERGAVNVVLVGVLVVLLTISFALIVPLGHAVAERRSASTAADAAALGGADYCADRLEQAYADAVASADGWGFWAQFGRPVTAYCAGASGQAEQMASSNGADLTRFAMTTGLRWRADVARRTEVVEVGTRARSHATAAMDLRTGACVSAGLFGVRAGGGCQTFPTEYNPQTGEPLRPVGYAPVARIDTELVAQ